MRIGIPKETCAGETRVATSPEALRKLLKKGFQVLIERGAGEPPKITDSVLTAEAAQIVDRAAAFGAEFVLKVQKPTSEKIPQIRKGSTLSSFLEPCQNDGTLDALARQGINTFAIELIPRRTRAQSVDALSSQANLAGYRA